MFRRCRTWTWVSRWHIRMIKFHQVKEKSLFSHSSCQDMHVIRCILNFGNCHGNVSLIKSVVNARIISVWIGFSFVGCVTLCYIIFGPFGGRWTLYDLYCLCFSKEVMVKLPRWLSGPPMMLIDIGMHLTQCNSGQNITIQFAYKYMACWWQKSALHCTGFCVILTLQHSFGDQRMLVGY